MSIIANASPGLPPLPALPNSAHSSEGRPILPFRFESVSVRAVEVDGVPWFVGKDVAEALGYADSTTAMRSHCRGVQKLHPIPDALGRLQDTRVLSESDVMRLIVNSTLAAAERFERWVFEEVLPSIRRTGGYLVQPVGQVGDGCALIESAARTLRLSPAVTLGMYQRLGNKVGHRDLLPQYAVDASNGIDGASSDVTLPLTRLLADFQVGLSAQRMNKLLKDAGVLEQVSRPSRRSTTKRYWSITTAGSRFGKNMTAPENPRETQPHYYRHTFPELLKLLGLTAPKAA
ncbi:Bro-N domain-containing protein [Stenotrophomonas pavanii]|uniref:BRO-N domain-containing protein n=1 Tax=Stenotrophomonas pavanii TaxID=487698 RepID=UPI002DB631F8|nr:Bro-N domain-containing protein [Stenotrophomonas pavanii]MEC4337651.1 Bro-N domain-containing protein [Stenotrophomonas pavanii]